MCHWKIIWKERPAGYFTSSANDWLDFLLSPGHVEENLGLYVKTHYSESFLSAERRNQCDTFGAEELPRRLQNKWVINTFFQKWSGNRRLCIYPISFPVHAALKKMCSSFQKIAYNESSFHLLATTQHCAELCVACYMKLSQLEFY